MDPNLESKLITWLAKDLKELGIKDFKFEVGPGLTGGHIADGFFLKVIENAENPKILHLVVKKGRSTQGDFSNGINDCCTNEILFYSKLLPRLLKFNDSKKTSKFENVPKCYAAELDGETQVIVMENLNASNYKMNDPKDALNVDHIKKVLEAYADWHALGMAFRDQHFEEFEKLAKLFRPIEHTEMIKAIHLSVKNMFNNFALKYEKRENKVFADKMRKLRDEFSDARKKLINPENTKYVVFKHGDNWNNNFLFHYKESSNIPSHVKIVDWQVVGAASPLLDITSFLYICTSKKELEHFDDLLKHYHKKFSKKLRELGSDPEVLFPFSALIDEWKSHAIFGLCQTIAFLQFRGKEKITYTAFNEEKDQDKAILEMDVQEEVYFKEVDDIYQNAAKYGFI